MFASVSESYEEALAEYLKAIELDPENSDAYIFCSALMADEGVLHEALLYAEKAKDLGHIRAEKLIKEINRLITKK